MNLTSVLHDQLLVFIFFNDCTNYNAPYIKHNISNLTYKHETIPAVYILVFAFKKILIINAIQSIKREMSQLFSYTCYVLRCKIVKETYHIYISVSLFINATTQQPYAHSSKGQSPKQKLL